ncbi:MAG TPA: ABC transporter substrate-binding protein, partial [Candidatus Babeliaceae bacterium]|nr:ABC transporter substrate-binding protein [Candidatus Babeliaceae bacterium]
MKVVYFFLILTLLASCGKPEAPSKKLHILRMNVNREPVSMDPRQGSEYVSSTLHFMLFEGLMRLNPDGSLTPAQAKSVEISDDRKTYTFHLRDTKWSDGTPVTAYDFEKAWKKILSPHFAAPSASLLYAIRNAEKAKRGTISLEDVGIHSTDPRTLIVELESPTPYFLSLVSFCVFFPVKQTADENP